MTVRNLEGRAFARLLMDIQFRYAAVESRLRLTGRASSRSSLHNHRLSFGHQFGDRTAMGAGN